MPTTAQGKIAPARGTLIKPGRMPHDSRWTRPLPWLRWLTCPLEPWGFRASAGLAFVNVVLPWLILRLVAGRRRYSIRALMALPFVAVLPLMAYLMLEPVLPVGTTPLFASEARIFIAGTLAGVPIVVYVLWLARSLVRLPVALRRGTHFAGCAQRAGDRRGLAPVRHEVDVVH